MIIFNSSPKPTIGVEIELQLIDEKDSSLKNIAPKLLTDIDKKFSDNVKSELIESMIEINTNICSTIEEAESNIIEILTHLEEVLKNYKTNINCTSLHPFSIGKNQIVTNNLRYQRIMKDLQIIGKRFITQGLHVHIGISNNEKAIRVNNALRIYLPLLLALSTSSPFYEGEDTGLYSYRTKLFEALPLAGMPDYLNDWNHFVNLTEQLQNAGIISSVKDLWWDVRPHPGFGTVEKAESNIIEILTHLEEILKNYKTNINCTSLHPFSIGKDQTVTNNLRYQRIMKDLQIIGKRFITQGLHVHIGIGNNEKAIRVNNALRIYLPLLLALSTSSPFYEGEDTVSILIEQNFFKLYH